MIELIQISFISIFAKLLKFAFEIGTNYFVDKETYGYFAVLLSFILIYSKIVSFGLPNIVIRDLPKTLNLRNKSDLMYNSALIMIFITLFAYIFILILDIKYLSEYLEVPIIALSTGLLILYSTYIRSNGYIKQWIFFQDINWYIFYFIGLALLYLINSQDIDTAMILQIYSYSIAFALVTIIFVIKFKYKLLLISKFSIKKIKYLYQHSFPVLFTGFTYLILSRIDVIMLGHYINIELVGEYNIIARITMQVLFFNQVVVAYFYPRLARKFAEKVPYNDIAIYNTKFVLLSIISVIFVSCFLLMLIKKFNLFVFLGLVHQEELILVFYIFAITQIIYSFISFYGHILLYIHKQKIEYINNIIILIVGIGLNFLLIPEYGIVGASIGSAVAIILGSFLEMIQVKYYAKTFFINLNLKKVFSK